MVGRDGFRATWIWKLIDKKSEELQSMPIDACCVSDLAFFLHI